MLSKLFKDLILITSKLPGVGPRQATRIIFWLSKNRDFLSKISLALADFQKHVAICQNCFLPFEITDKPNQKNVCDICASPKRENIIAIIEKETDALSMEESGVFKGRYFILGGKVSALRKNNDSLRFKELKNLIRKKQAENNLPKEIIIATSTTAEGELTAQELKKSLEDFPDIKVTRIGMGIPVGGEIEFVDPETLRESFEGRK